MARLYIEGEHGDAENFREAVGETPALHNFISRPEKINPLLMTQLLSQVINSIINLLSQLSHTRNKIINYNYLKKVEAVRSRGVELHRDVTTVVIVGDSILQPHPAVGGVLKNNIALTMCSHPNKPVMYTVNLSDRRNKWSDTLHQATLLRLASLEPDTILLSLGEARLAYLAERSGVDEAVEDFMAQAERSVVKLAGVLPTTTRPHMIRKPKILAIIPRQG